MLDLLYLDGCNIDTKRLREYEEYFSSVTFSALNRLEK